MRTRAAIIRQPGKPWEITELELDQPKQGEVLIKFAASGLCHSDGFHDDDGADLGGFCMLGTFAERAVVSQNSCVPIEADLPFEVAALTGCGVPTGWGTAVYAAGVRAGQTVVIFGAGGVGSNAVQAVVDLTRGQLAANGSVAGWQRRIQGHVFGMCNPLYDIPRLLRLYRAGQLKLDELITRRYSLDDVNAGYQDLDDGTIIRGVITHAE
jgi:Zn-dependent alcohol dehydrogenase